MSSLWVSSTPSYAFIKSLHLILSLSDNILMHILRQKFTPPQKSALLKRKSAVLYCEMTDLGSYLGSTTSNLSDFMQVISTLCLSYLMGMIVIIITIFTLQLTLRSNYIALIKETSKLKRMVNMSAIITGFPNTVMLEVTVPHFWV